MSDGVSLDRFNVKIFGFSQGDLEEMVRFFRAQHEISVRLGRHRPLRRQFIRIVACLTTESHRKDYICAYTRLLARGSAH